MDEQGAADKTQMEKGRIKGGTRSDDLGGIYSDLARMCLVKLEDRFIDSYHIYMIWAWNLARNVNGKKKDSPRSFISKRRTRETASEWGRKWHDRGH